MHVGKVNADGTVDLIVPGVYDADGITNLAREHCGPVQLMSASKRPRLADDSDDDSSASSETAHRRFDDVVAAAQDEAAQYGVSWVYFDKGQEKENRKVASQGSGSL